MEHTRITVIDSHTEGEPTRVVVDGAPDLGGGSAADRLERLRREHDNFRSCVVNEPRGHDAMVGTLVGEPLSSESAAQLIFFNNVGYLGMCVHGTIGATVTLAHLGRLQLGRHRFETPVGDVAVELHTGGAVSVENVRSYRLIENVSVATSHHGTVKGDVAYGGNWFFLVKEPEQVVSSRRLTDLTAFAVDVRQALRRSGIRGDEGAEVDHVEIFGLPERDGADSKNFVLCPGNAYDRSPCGTGTAAKIACLAADGKLAEGQTWHQESIIGSQFEGSYRVVPDGNGVIPTLTGRAWITAEATLLVGREDPLSMGIAS